MSIPYELRENLVAEYLFKGNTIDSSGNSNDGTVSGATLTPNNLGEIDRAYKFDGSTNKIEASTVDTSADFTISGLFYLNAYSDNQALISNRESGGGDNGFELIQTPSVPNGYAIQAKVDCSTSTGTVTGTTALGTGIWRHIILTRSGSTLTVYLDGVDDTSSTSAATGDGTSTANLWIGDGAFNSRTNFNGNIANIRIWNEALTSDQVTQVYQADVDPLSIDLEISLMCAGDATDSSGNSNDCTVTGAVLTKDNEGWDDRAYLFDQNDYIQKANYVANHLPLSFSCWVKFTSISSTNGVWIANQRDGTGTSDKEWQLGLGTSGAEVKVGLIDDSDNWMLLETGLVPVTGTWYHFGFATSGASGGDLKFYLNGAFHSTFTLTADRRVISRY